MAEKFKIEDSGKKSELRIESNSKKYLLNGKEITKEMYEKDINNIDIAVERNCTLITPSDSVIELTWRIANDSNDENGTYMEARIQKRGEQETTLDRQELLSPHGFIIMEDENGELDIRCWGHSGTSPRSDYGDAIIKLFNKEDDDSVKPVVEIKELLEEEMDKDTEIEEWSQRYNKGNYTPEDIRKLNPNAKNAWVIKDEKTIVPITLSK